jgi:outer membrane protein assembly factor BamE (lipoprotein component of BamABCDE complex)
MTREFIGMVKILSVLFICFTLLMPVGCSQEQPSQPGQTTSSSTSSSSAEPAKQATTAPQPSSVGPQNIAQIQVGMSSQQVLDILGKPGRVKQEGQHTEWEYYHPQGKCELKLQNDRVVSVKRH